MKKGIILTLTILLLACSCTSKTAEKPNDTSATNNPSPVPTEEITNIEETTNNNEVSEINQECRRLYDEWEKAIDTMWEYRNKTAEELADAADTGEIDQWLEYLDNWDETYQGLLEQMQNIDYEALSDEDLAYVSDVINRVDPKLKELGIK